MTGSDENNSDITLSVLWVGLLLDTFFKSSRHKLTLFPGRVIGLGRRGWGGVKRTHPGQIGLKVVDGWIQPMMLKHIWKQQIIYEYSFNLLCAL